jgi:hypothetical protein
VVTNKIGQRQHNHTQSSGNTVTDSTTLESKAVKKPLKNPDNKCSKPSRNAFRNYNEKTTR